MAFVTVLPMATRSAPVSSPVVYSTTNGQAGGSPRTINTINIKCVSQNWTNPANTMTITVEQDPGDGFRLLFRDTYNGTRTQRDGSVVAADPQASIGFFPSINDGRPFRASITYTGSVTHDVELELL